MKNFVPVVIALVIGIALGAWQPRGEVLGLRQQVDELRAANAKAQKGRGINQIREMFQTADAAAQDAPGRKRRGPPAGDRPPSEPAAAEPGANGRGGEGGEGVDEQQIAAVQAAMDARRAHAREALAEQADVDAEALDRVDQIMDEMNAALKKELDTFAESALEGGEVERRDFLELGANALDVVLTADDAMREALSAEVYDAVDDELVDPFSFVSGDTLAGVVKLRDLPGFEQE